VICLVHVRGGWICLAAAERGIAACTLPQPTPQAGLALVDASLGKPARGDSVLPEVSSALQRYFAGEKEVFDLPLDLSRVSDFSRRVLRAVARIPYGETRSYGEIARAVGRPGAARAVGGVIARNPLAPIVPCHRVIGSDGGLVGFGGARGRRRAPALRVKERLLQMEGAWAAQAKGR